MYMAFKHLHLTFVVLTLGFFLLRALLLLAYPKALKKRLLKILPHVIDTLLILSALGLLGVMQMNPFQVPWVLAKILGLLAYVGFALYAFKWAANTQGRLLGLVLAGASLAYILLVAVQRTPLPFF
ncbi:SirB2 family protein [Nitrincola tapanii]|uniref:Regulator SirB n=1 Tax=Nitrincola tapanii TaxID=1708751 RepID=A0A5A9W6J4_9GAMM|nr:SirB2 family protein [Nitrincola tapanii]KAA0876420.1 regulator SirB [Nitrincola tapanii]